MRTTDSLCNSRRTEARALIRKEERSSGKGHTRQRKQHKQRPGGSRKYRSERYREAWLLGKEGEAGRARGARR